MPRDLKIFLFHTGFCVILLNKNIAQHAQPVVIIQITLSWIVTEQQTYYSFLRKLLDSQA
jgi:hypothetical protein